MTYIPGGGGSSTSGPLPVGLRQIATACCAPNYSDNFASNFIGRTSHFAGDEISALSVVSANYWINTSGFAETGSASTVSVASWVEYPMGNYTATTYSGVATASIASGGQVASDLTPLTVTIPHGARFWVWQRVIYTTGTGRVLTSSGAGNSYAQGGEGMSTSGVTASTTPSSINFGNIGSSTGFRPVALLGMTTRRAFLVLGDSRCCYGVGDARDGGYPDFGEIGRGLGATQPYPIPYISVGQTGESMNSLIAAGSAGRTNTVALGNYVSDIINQLGINDCIGGVSLATMQGNYATITGYFSGSPHIWLTTKPPVTTSTDNWATTANQTTAASNAVRVSLNNWIRGTPSGYQGFFDPANIVESGYNSGLWAVTGAANGYTVDGTHESPLAYRAIRDAKLFSN